MTTVALIPSYQPNVRLFDLLRALRDKGIERVVVDDGSGERYWKLFQRATRDAVVLSYGVNHGKGHALKLGLRYIAEHYPADTVVVTVDADGQHDVADTIRCAEEAEHNPHSMVLGCRSFDADDVPLRSRMGNKITRTIYHLASGTRLSDTQTGLRAFTADLITFLVGVGGERYEYEMNVLLACPERDVSIREVPIHTIYEENNSSSHFHPVRDSARIYAGILAFMGSSFASFVVDFCLFAVLSALLGAFGAAGVAAANVLARVASATFNFTVNRCVVFRSQESVRATALRYASLAAGILLANTCLLVVATDVCGVPGIVAKLAVEAIMFVVSWVLQNRFVFRKKRR